MVSFHGNSSINDDLCPTVWYSLRFKFNTRCINWYEYLERYYFYRSYAKGDYLGDTRNRQVLPPMYARYYRNLSETDLKAIWVYLQTVKLVKNEILPPLNSRGRPY